MAQDLIPVVQRSYDLCAGLYEHVNRFPRAQRGLLGRVILDDALQMLVSLTVANRRRDRSETLAEASGRLDALRITLRLSQRLGFLSNGGYAQLSEGADEIGRMLGGWMKRDRGRAGAGPEPGRRVRAEPVNDIRHGADSAAPSTRIANPVEGHAPSCPPTDARRHPGGVRYKMTSPTVEKYLRVKLDHWQSPLLTIRSPSSPRIRCTPQRRRSGAG